MQVLCVVRKVFHVLNVYFLFSLYTVYALFRLWRARDAGVVGIGYCRSRLITQCFWLGGLDPRSAVRQKSLGCVVSSAENIGAHHTQYDQADFLIFMCWGSADKKSLRIYNIRNNEFIYHWSQTMIFICLLSYKPFSDRVFTIGSPLECWHKACHFKQHASIAEPKETWQYTS